MMLENIITYVYYHVESRVLGSASSAMRQLETAPNQKHPFLYTFGFLALGTCVFVCAYASCIRVTDAEQPPND